MAAPRGIPKKTATLVATTEYEMVCAAVSPLITPIKRMASGAYNIICSSELTATRIAQYSLSPPASPFHMRT